MLRKLTVADFLPHRIQIGRFLRPHVNIHGLANSRIVGFKQRVSHRRLKRQMKLKIREFVNFDRLYFFGKCRSADSPRQPCR